MDVRGRLRLRLDRDTDGTAELFIEASAAGFVGRSSAWFGIAAIGDFATALDAFPIHSDRPPRLAGGFWARDSSNPVLDQEHVFVEVRPIGRRGTVQIEIRLTTPKWDGSGDEVQNRVSLGFLTDYGTLQRFARDVAALASGVADEALLESDATPA